MLTQVRKNKKLLITIELISLIAALLGVGCSPVGETRSYLTFKVDPAFHDGFIAASARLEKATGLVAVEDSQGIVITWGNRGTGQCNTHKENINGVLVPQYIHCDPMADGMNSQRAIEDIILHELLHIFNSGARLDHPEDGSVALPAPPAGACLNSADLEFTCVMDGCSAFNPEC